MQRDAGTGQCAEQFAPWNECCNKKAKEKKHKLDREILFVLRAGSTGRRTRCRAIAGDWTGHRSEADQTEEGRTAI